MLLRSPPTWFPSPSPKAARRMWTRSGVCVDVAANRSVWNHAVLRGQPHQNPPFGSRQSRRFRVRRRRTRICFGEVDGRFQSMGTRRRPWAACDGRIQPSEISHQTGRAGHWGRRELPRDGIVV
jgi:hypothetical protein